MTYKKICLTGAQGTGKTTVLNLFKEVGFPVVTEVVRNLVKTKGISINQDGNGETQMMVFNEYKRILGDTFKYVSDRGLTDVLSYTRSGIEAGKVDEEVYSRQLSEFVNFTEKNPDVVYIYFPIEFPVVDDGVRSTDETYRAEIDSLILMHLKAYGLKFIEVHGTPEERFRQILDFVGPDLI